MPVIPTGSLYGPSLAASADGAASFEGLLQGLSTLPKVLSGAGQGQANAQDVYNNRMKARQDQALHAADLVSKLTYGGGNALTQALSGQKPTSAGPGGATGGIAPTPIHAMQAEARRLSELRALANDQQSRRNYGLSPLGRALTPEAALEGLANPAEEIGLPAGMVLRPEAMARIAHLLNTGDSSVGSALTALGLPADTKAEDLTGMSQRLQEYQSDIAGRIGKKQEGESKLDLAGRALLMRERLLQMGYDSDNIEDVAMELAKLPDEAARFAIGEMGRPTKFGHEMRLAKRRSVKTIINKYVGLENKGGGGGSRSSSGGRSASELGKEVQHLRTQLNSIVKTKKEEWTEDHQRRKEDMSDKLGKLQKLYHEQWLREEEVNRGVPVVDFNAYYKGMSNKEQAEFWGNTVRAVKGQIALGNKKGRVLRLAAEADKVMRSPAAQQYLSDIYDKFSGAGDDPAQFLEAVGRGKTPGVAEGDPARESARRTIPQGGGATTSTVPLNDMGEEDEFMSGWATLKAPSPLQREADPVDSVRQAVEQDIVETAEPRVTTTVSSLDEYKRGRADEARSRRDHPSTWGERAPREVPVGPYADAEMFFDMVEDDVLSGVVRDPVVVLKEADKIALAFERENPSVRHSSKSYRAGAGSGRVAPGEPAPEIVKAREFLKAAVALSTRGGSRDYKPIYNERDFLPDVDPDQRGLNISRPVKGGIKNNVTGRKTYFRSFLGEGGAPERPSHDRYERERLAAAAKKVKASQGGR